MPAPSLHIRIHCKTGSASAQLVFEKRAECQEFVARFKDDGLTYKVDSLFCNTSATILVRQSKSPEDREIGRRFKPPWEVLAKKKILDKDALMYEHKSSAYTIAETEL